MPNQIKPRTTRVLTEVEKLSQQREAKLKQLYWEEAQRRSAILEVYLDERLWTKLKDLKEQTAEAEKRINKWYSIELENL